ncbi:MAG: patatin-like phospholipase family protein [Burkholderiales bacterium]|nr:MAG: patatin-like phospholipase family protein [Burkholderiales bacterium]
MAISGKPSVSPARKTKGLRADRSGAVPARTNGNAAIAATPVPPPSVHRVGKAKLDHEHIALVLQGGGALGAYQAGVFEVLSQFPREPHWVAGVSIGAINAALIAGNPPARRLERLHAFWNLVSSSASGLIAPVHETQWQSFHQINATVAMAFGVPGFYVPRFPPPALQMHGTDAAISYYDTAPLRSTLERLVDFDRINSKAMRFSVGAVQVRTGNTVYFDNHHQRIGPEHIMASGALPPAFAPVVIDGEAYWDGGIVSNTPLQYVLDNRGKGKTLAVQVDLFSARGDLPTNMAAAMARQKDIQYSSRTRMSTTMAAETQRHKCTVLRLIDKLPPEMRQDPEVQALEAASRTPHVDIVHLIYRQNRLELDSKDYEFSRATMQMHWAAGRRDMQMSIDNPDWLKPSTLDDGVTVYDLTPKLP